MLCKFSLISYINYNNKAYIKEIEYKQNDNENNTQITVYKNIFSYDSIMKSLVIKESKTNICHRIIFIGNGVSNYVNGLNDNYDTGLPIVFDYSGLRTRITDYLNNSIFVVLDGNGNTSYVYDSLGNIKYQILNNNLIESKIINYKTNIKEDITKIIKLKDWSTIVTHNPEGEYGSLQHKLTSQIVTSISPKKKLYYFGKYYTKKSIVNEQNKLSQINQNRLNQKIKLIGMYKTETYIQTEFNHMYKYEEWIKYKEWSK